MVVEEEEEEGGGGGGTAIIRPRYINRCLLAGNPVIDSILVEREWSGSFGWTCSVKELDSPDEDGDGVLVVNNEL